MPRTCGNCGSRLEEVDYIGTFFTPMFKSGVFRFLSVIPILLLSSIGVVLINEFVSEASTEVVKYVYYLVVLVLTVFIYKRHFDFIIYKCSECSSYFKGIKRIPFDFTKHGK